jgi:hypothetical protein
MAIDSPPGTPSSSSMKTIVYRGGVLKFRIPASWMEEYSDIDGGMFYEEVPGSGTLRVKVITLRAPTNTSDRSVVEVFEPLMRHFVRNEDGEVTDVAQVGQNALMRYQQMASERGTKIRIFYWVFGNPVPPDHARIVTFSYTVMASQTDKPRTIKELEILDNEITQTEFASKIGA